MKKDLVIKIFVKVIGIFLIALALYLHPILNKNLAYKIFIFIDPQANFILSFISLVIFVCGFLIVFVVRKKYKEVALMIFVVFLSLLFLEFVLRSIDNKLADNFLFLRDKDLGWIGNPKYSNNRHGFNEEDFDFRNLAENNLVYAVGDSFGYEFITRNTLVSQLDQYFPDQKIINLSMGGYGAKQYKDVFEKYAAIKKPKYLLVFFYTGNDFADSKLNAYSMLETLTAIGFLEDDRDYRFYLVKDSYLFLRKAHLWALQFFYEETASSDVNYLQSIQRRALGNSDNKDGSLNINESLDNLTSLINSARAKDVKTFFVIIPQDYQVKDEVWSFFEASTDLGVSDNFNTRWAQDIMSSYLDEQGTAYYDFLDDLRSVSNGLDIYYKNDMHFNELGHGLSAKLIADKLKEINFFDNEK